MHVTFTLKKRYNYGVSPYQFLLEYIREYQSALMQRLPDTRQMERIEGCLAKRITDRQFILIALLPLYSLLSASFSSMVRDIIKEVDLSCL